MKKYIFSFFRSYIIKKMDAAYMGSDLQNHILKTFGLREKEKTLFSNTKMVERAFQQFSVSPSSSKYKL